MELQPSRYENVTTSGEILLSHHHISLLHGLRDRPEGIALSVGDWLLASLPYGRRYLDYVSVGMLQKAIAGGAELVGQVPALAASEVVAGPVAVAAKAVGAGR